jgi:hypothetical protein
MTSSEHRAPGVRPRIHPPNDSNKHESATEEYHSIYQHPGLWSHANVFVLVDLDASTRSTDTEEVGDSFTNMPGRNEAATTTEEADAISNGNVAQIGTVPELDDFGLPVK